MRTLKASFFSRKPFKLLETENLAEVQFVIDSCRFVSQSNDLNNSNKDFDCPGVAQWWERSPPTSVAWVQILDPVS